LLRVFEPARSLHAATDLRNANTDPDSVFVAIESLLLALSQSSFEDEASSSTVSISLSSDGLSAIKQVIDLFRQARAKIQWQNWFSQTSPPEQAVWLSHMWMVRTDLRKIFLPYFENSDIEFLTLPDRSILTFSFCWIVQKVIQMMNHSGSMHNYSFANLSSNLTELSAEAYGIRKELTNEINRDRSNTEKMDTLDSNHGSHPRSNDRTRDHQRYPQVEVYHDASNHSGSSSDKVRNLDRKEARDFSRDLHGLVQAATWQKHQSLNDVFTSIQSVISLKQTEYEFNVAPENRPFLQVYTIEHRILNMAHVLFNSKDTMKASYITNLETLKQTMEQDFRNEGGVDTATEAEFYFVWQKCLAKWCKRYDPNGFAKAYAAYKHCFSSSTPMTLVKAPQETWESCIDNALLSYQTLQNHKSSVPEIDNGKVYQQVLSK
jgi:hypothetical protein